MGSFRSPPTMPGPAASATNVGAGSPRTTSSPRSGGGGGARQRAGKASSGTVRTGQRAGGTSSGGMWRFYTDDSPGIKVGPVPVLVMSLLFIACVFMLHIWENTTGPSEINKWKFCPVSYFTVLYLVDSQLSFLP